MYNNKIHLYNCRLGMIISSKKNKTKSIFKPNTINVSKNQIKTDLFINLDQFSFKTMTPRHTIVQSTSLIFLYKITHFKIYAPST